MISILRLRIIQISRYCAAWRQSQMKARHNGFEIEKVPVTMSVSRHPIFVFMTLLLSTLHKTTNNLTKIPSLSPAVQKPALFLSQNTEEKTRPSEIDIMDFYAPLHPLEGEKMELSCGFKVSENMRLQQIEWYRVTDTHQVRSGQGQAIFLCLFSLFSWIVFVLPSLWIRTGHCV